MTSAKPAVKVALDRLDSRYKVDMGRGVAAVALMDARKAGTVRRLGRGVYAYTVGSGSRVRFMEMA